MRAVVQRVSEASVSVGGEVRGRIDQGLLVLLAAGHGDGPGDLDSMVRKVTGLRIFEDADGKMNRAVADVGGGLLVVSQFSLYGDCRKGRRPSFIHAMEPTAADLLVQDFVTRCRALGLPVETGVFGAHMEVSLTNDGPVTILIDSKKVF
ncbi:MAG: D-aminoacyl-tRNA deacylase [Pseudomonadota bacterium]